MDIVNERKIDRLSDAVDALSDVVGELQNNFESVATELVELRRNVLTTLGIPEDLSSTDTPSNPVENFYLQTARASWLKFWQSKVRQVGPEVDNTAAPDLPNDGTDELVNQALEDRKKAGLLGTD